MSDVEATPSEFQMLVPSKVQCIAISLGSMVCALFLFWVWWDGIEYAWVAGGFMAASSVYYAAHLLRGAFSLTLTLEGFTIVELYTPKHYIWSNISDIVLRKGVIGPSVEFYDLSGGGMLRVKMNETYGMRPRQLAALMLEWRAKGGDASTPQTENVWRN